LKIPTLNKLSSLQVFQVFRFGAPFIISIILVRLLDPEQIGIYESLTLIGASFTFFWVSGIINTFIPYYHSINEEKRPELIFNVFILLSALSVLCFLILLSLKTYLFARITGAGMDYLYPYFLVYTLFNAPAFLMEYLLLVKNKPKIIVWYGLLVSGMQILALALPLWLGYGLQTAVLVLALSSFLKFILLSVYVSRTGKAVISAVLLKPFLNKAAPAVLTLIVGGSMPYIDSYIILHFYDKANFAIYQYGAREMPLVLLMANALSNVFSGEIAAANLGNQVSAGLEKLKKSSKRLMHSLFPLTIVLILASRYLFAHVYSEHFIFSAAVFNVFMLLTISRLIFPQTLMMGLLKNKELFWFNAIEWVINLVLDFIFLYQFGMIGIAWATVIAYFSERVMLVIYLNRKGYPPAAFIPLKTWGLYSVAVLLAFFVGYVIGY
jgi:O-antigen/teichoic acid export membrane protein